MTPLGQVTGCDTDVVVVVESTKSLVDVPERCGLPLDEEEEKTRVRLEEDFLIMMAGDEDFRRQTKQRTTET
jgi:hypothetical protein